MQRLLMFSINEQYHSFIENISSLVFFSGSYPLLLRRHFLLDVVSVIIGGIRRVKGRRNNPEYLFCFFLTRSIVADNQENSTAE